MNKKDIRAALTIKNHTFTIQGNEYTVRRPSVADLISAAEESKGKNNFAAWLTLTHLIDEQGEPVFNTIEEVLICDVRMIERIADEVEPLYGEGRD
jgi:hypothetical protein